MKTDVRYMTLNGMQAVPSMTMRLCGTHQRIIPPPAYKKEQEGPGHAERGGGERQSNYTAPGPTSDTHHQTISLTIEREEIREYEGKIIYGGTEYEFTIDAATGSVTEWDAGEGPLRQEK